MAKLVDTVLMLFFILFKGSIFGTIAFYGVVDVVKGLYGGNSPKILFQYKAL